MYHVAKDIVVFALLLFRDWMSKVERARSRTSDSQEGWKEASEDHAANKTSWADSGDPRAPSPAGAGQYKSTPQQDLQVEANAPYVNIYTSKPVSFNNLRVFWTSFPGW